MLKYSKVLKRTFDIFFSLFGLIVLSPLFLAVSILIKLDSRGPVFFRQERMGRNFGPFRIFKFRSMMPGAPGKGPSITVSGDKRVTRVGKYLRKFKIDELPQLINVFTGNMSLVGPRPEVRKYVEIFRKDYKRLLTVRPGITDPASITFRDEERLLSESADWERDYLEKVLPEKIRLALTYLEDPSLLTDIKLILKTLIRI